MRKTRTTWALLLACFLLPSAPAARSAVENGSGLSLPAGLPSPDTIDYGSFGAFEGVGTAKYRFVIKDRPGLAKAAGAGIFPNEDALRDDPQYRRLVAAKRLEGPLDAFLPEVDPVLSFYKWASLKGAQNQGLRLYNVARSLEKMGRPREALKAYHAVAVHFPKSVSWNAGSPWYIGVAALDAAHRLVDQNPGWGLALRDADIRVVNGFDQKGTNDVFIVNPGRLVGAADAKTEERRAATHARTLYDRGGVKLVRWSNGDWQLLVHDRPFMIRGVAYFPTPVGRSPDYGYKAHSEWMTADENENKRIDGPYDAWVDANLNNTQDPDEPSVGDFRLMSEMGVNTIRLYHQAANKSLLRDLNANHGIRVLMGDLVGAYTVGSGASFAAGTDYADPKQRARMRDGVRAMIETHRNEDYVLMWVLGNENNYGHGNSARRDPRTYYRFLNSLARMIHILDPDRPVAICNGDLENLNLIARECPDVDVLAVNAYRGENGMGRSFWANAKTVWRKPVLISEFGHPAHNAAQNAADAQKTQAEYLVTNWNDIEAHASGARTGNAIGGVVFEWIDEWWKAGPQYEASIQDKVPQTRGAFHGGWIYEEWLGLATNGSGEHSPFLRQLRPAYFAMKNGPWREPMNFAETQAQNSNARAGAPRAN